MLRRPGHLRSPKRALRDESTLELCANVNNVLDRGPPLVLADYLSTQVGGGYDQFGRRYVLGFNLKF